MSDTEESEENTNIGSEDNNWGKFFLDVLKAIVTVIILAILGGNYVYLTRINLDMFFPTDVDERPYTDKNKVDKKLPPLCPTKEKYMEMVKMSGGKKMKGGNTGGGCGPSINMCDSKILQNKYFEGMFDYGFPYTLTSKEQTFGGIITSWFSNKVKYSNIWLRSIVKSIISFSASFCAFTPDSAKDIVPFILGPFIMSMLLFISSFWYFPSFVSLWWNEDSDWGMLFSFVGLFFGWTWLTPMAISFVQMFGLMFKLLLIPLMMNPIKILEIVSQDFNAWFLKFIFFLMTILAAFKNLNIVVAVVMTIVFLPNLIPPGINITKKSE